jgi:hypothetical protein
MKPGLTSFAKGVIYLIGLSALAGCLILVPELAREDITKHPTTAYLSLFFVVSAYAVATPTSSTVKPSRPSQLKP